MPKCMPTAARASRSRAALHRLLRVEVDGPHDRPWLVGADRQASEVDRSGAAADLREAVEERGVARVVEAAPLSRHHEAAPETAVAVGEPAAGEVTGGDARHRDAGDPGVLPPAELGRHAAAGLPHELADPGRHDEGHAALRETPERRPVGVVVVVVGEEGEVEAGERVERHARRDEAPRAGEGERARALGVDRVGQECRAVEAHVQRRVADPGHGRVALEGLRVEGNDGRGARSRDETRAHASQQERQRDAGVGQPRPGHLRFRVILHARLHTRPLLRGAGCGRVVASASSDLLQEAHGDRAPPCPRLAPLRHRRCIPAERRAARSRPRAGRDRSPRGGLEPRGLRRARGAPLRLRANGQAAADRGRRRGAGHRGRPPRPRAGAVLRRPEARQASRRPGAAGAPARDRPPPRPDRRSSSPAATTPASCTGPTVSPSTSASASVSTATRSRTRSDPRHSLISTRPAVRSSPSAASSPSTTSRRGRTGGAATTTRRSSASCRSSG